MCRRLSPCSSKWVAKLWRSEWTEIFFYSAVGEHQSNCPLRASRVHVGRRPADIIRRSRRTGEEEVWVTMLGPQRAQPPVREIG